MKRKTRSLLAVLMTLAFLASLPLSVYAQAADPVGASLGEIIAQEIEEPEEPQPEIPEEPVQEENDLPAEEAEAPAEPAEPVPGEANVAPARGVPQPDITVTAKVNNSLVTTFVLRGFPGSYFETLAALTPDDFVVEGVESAVTGVVAEEDTLTLHVEPFDADSAFRVVYVGSQALSLSFSGEDLDETIYGGSLPFVVRNENFAFLETTAAVVIDAGKEVNTASLDMEKFNVNARTIRKFNPSVEVYNGPRTIINAYASEVDNWGQPADSGRYIVLEFKCWYAEDGGNPDGGSTTVGGYSLTQEYTVNYDGAIEYADGSALQDIEFEQAGIVSPIVDQFQYGRQGNLDYQYFISDRSEEPLPLVVFFHGGGQGNDIESNLRFSNGATVWANPEIQDEYPSHVIAPRNCTTASAMGDLVAAIDGMIEDGLVDANRVYITGYSMGGGSTWTFLNNYPEYVAAAAPQCVGSGPSSVEKALAMANVPVWGFVTVGDGPYNGMVQTFNTYGQYFNDIKLTILEENVVNAYPYDGWVFDPHCVWLPIYNPDEWQDEERGPLIEWMFGQVREEPVEADPLPFVIRNENFVFLETTAAVVIDAGKEVSTDSLDMEKFAVNARTVRKFSPDFEVYNGPRTIIDVYASEVDNWGEPADSGRYIVLEFKCWFAEDGGNPDGGSTTVDGYSLTQEYTISYDGAILYEDGTSLTNAEFVQDGIVSPIVDQFQYGREGSLDYQYFISDRSEEPLPLVVFFHGGGQGNDIESNLRFSNGATVWANPEMQEEYPCHVIAPRNCTTASAMDNLVAAIDGMIAEGKVDKNRVYVTGYSMGGGSTWTFLNNYPDVAAAAAPLCAAGSPANVAAAEAVADLPIWAFVTEGDFLMGMVMNVDTTYGPYFNDYMLTILEENVVNEYPYNGWVFDAHCVWLPIYNPAEYQHEERGTFAEWLFAQEKKETMPFTIRNENFIFLETTAAVVIDAGKEVDTASLDIDKFAVNARTVRKFNPSYEVYNGPRTIIDVYASEVDNWGEPADSGRYIVLEFKCWPGEDGNNPDGGSTTYDGFSLAPEYTISYDGSILFADGTSAGNILFAQTDIISPIVDQFQYGQEGTLDYQYFISDRSEEPLPLVVFFHGGGQGNDIESNLRFSNGATVWANPEMQEEYPCHVIAPRNASNAAAMDNLVAVIDSMIAEGKVDKNRVYVTGYSMGGASTWTFLNNYPDVAAAAAPLCAAGSPANVEAAKAMAGVPLWAFVTEGDFLWGMVMNVDTTYGPYFKDYKLTVLEENVVNEYPYNGHVFDPHCVWLPIYNPGEWQDEERGALIDWMFAQTRVESVKINEGAMVSMSRGQTLQLTTAINGGSGSGTGFTWTSSVPATATVDENGMVTALKAGMTVITVTAPNGVKTTVTIRVM